MKHMRLVCILTLACALAACGVRRDLKLPSKDDQSEHAESHASEAE